MKFTSEPRDATSQWDHTVLSATRQRWPPRLHPNRAVWYSIYRPRKDERLSWPRGWYHIMYVFVVCMYALVSINGVALRRTRLVPGCPTLSNPVLWQSWMAAYPSYTLQMKMMFPGWPIMVYDTHTRRRRRSACMGDHVRMGKPPGHRTRHAGRLSLKHPSVGR